MKTVIAIVVASILGTAVGTGAALLRARHDAEPPNGGAKVHVDGTAYDFGDMDASKDGSHDFTFTNQGQRLLTLKAGATTCSCTVGEIVNPLLSPGQSTAVRIKWKSKHVAMPFKQSVTINTSDMDRPEVVLTIRGTYTTPLEFIPDELDFGQLVGDQLVTRELRIFSTLPKQPLQITHYEFADRDLAKFFDVTTRAMSTQEAKERNGAESGVLVTLTVKPGLPPGEFRQTILVRTNQEGDNEYKILMHGTAGKEVSVAGPGWSDDSGLLTVGPVKTGAAVQRQLVLIARGKDAKDVRYNVVHVEPDFLKVKLGETTLADDGKLAQTMLTIEIPPRTAAANYMDDGHAQGEIRIDTTNAKVDQLRLRVRFKIEDGTPVPATTREHTTR